MLWLIVIFLIGALSFVIFHKPHVNAMGAGWTPPEKRPHAHPAPDVGAMAPDGSSEEAVTAPVAKQVPPRHACASAIQDRVDEEPVADERLRAGSFLRQVLPQPGPLFVRQSMTSHSKL